MIFKTQIKPRLGYKIKEDANGVQYYLPIVDRRVTFEQNSVTFREDGVFKVPAAKLNRFRVTLVGGGGDALAGVNGSAGQIRTYYFNLSPKNEEGNDNEIYICVGKGGTNGMAGGATSFGTHAMVNGGSAGVESNNNGYEYLNERFGSGADNDEAAKNGLVIIGWDNYVSFEPVYPNADDMIEPSEGEAKDEEVINPETVVEE